MCDVNETCERGSPPPPPTLVLASLRCPNRIKPNRTECFFRGSSQELPIFAFLSTFTHHSPKSSTKLVQGVGGVQFLASCSCSPAAPKKETKGIQNTTKK